MKENLRVWLVEYFNENENCWEWGNIERQSDYTEKQARLSTMADNFGCEYIKETDEIKGDIDDINYIKENWEENTRAWDLSV